MKPLIGGPWQANKNGWKWSLSLLFFCCCFTIIRTILSLQVWFCYKTFTVRQFLGLTVVKASEGKIHKVLGCTEPCLMAKAKGSAVSLVPTGRKHPCVYVEGSGDGEGRCRETGAGLYQPNHKVLLPQNTVSPKKCGNENPGICLPFSNQIWHFEGSLPK